MIIILETFLADLVNRGVAVCKDGCCPSLILHITRSGLAVYICLLWKYQGLAFNLKRNKIHYLGTIRIENQTLHTTPTKV